MKKTILIIHRDADARNAIMLQSTLLQGGYDAILNSLSENEVYTYAESISPSDYQMVICVDCFGFERSAVDGGSYYNRTPVNVLAILYDSAKKYIPCFEQRINFTTYFLTFIEDDVQYILDNYPHIYHADAISSIDDIPAYLDSFDWRY